MERYITGPAYGRPLSGAGQNLYGENQSGFLMEKTCRDGTPWGRINGRRKPVFCEVINPGPTLLPIKRLLILNYILNSVIQKEVTVECTFGAGTRYRL